MILLQIKWIFSAVSAWGAVSLFHVSKKGIQKKNKKVSWRP